MSLVILWTEEATTTFDSIVEFIYENWGEKATKKFVQKVNKVLNSISLQPYLFKASLQQNIRQGIISKQTSFYYQVHTTHITIIYFWDNRQEPLLNQE